MIMWKNQSCIANWKMKNPVIRYRSWAIRFPSPSLFRSCSFHRHCCCCCTYSSTHNILLQHSFNGNNPLYDEGYIFYLCASSINTNCFRFTFFEKAFCNVLVSYERWIHKVTIGTRTKPANPVRCNRFLWEYECEVQRASRCISNVISNCGHAPAAKSERKSFPHWFPLRSFFSHLHCNTPANWPNGANRSFVAQARNNERNKKYTE